MDTSTHTNLNQGARAKLLENAGIDSCHAFSSDCHSHMYFDLSSITLPSSSTLSFLDAFVSAIISTSCCREECSTLADDDGDVEWSGRTRLFGARGNTPTLKMIPKCRSVPHNSRCPIGSPALSACAY